MRIKEVLKRILFKSDEEQAIITAIDPDGLKHKVIPVDGGGWIEINGDTSVTFDDNGNPVRIILNGRDITNL